MIALHFALALFVWPWPQDPAAAVEDVRGPVDPTVQDALLRAAETLPMPAVGAPSGPLRLPAARLRSLVQPAGAPARASLDVGGERVELVVGDRLAPQGEPGPFLVVEALGPNGLELRDPDSGERWRDSYVTLAVLRPTSIERGPAPAARDVRLDLLDLREVSVAEACRTLSDVCGANFAPSQDAASRSVSTYLRDVTADAALNALCDTHDLWLSRDSDTGVVRVRTTAEYGRKLDGLQQESIEYFTLLYPNVLDVGQAIRSLFGRRVIFRSDNQDFDMTRDLVNRLNRFDLFEARTQSVGGLDGFGSGSNNTNQGSGISTLSETGLGLNSSYPGGAQSGSGSEFTDSESALEEPPEASEALTAGQMTLLERLLQGDDGEARARLSELIDGVYDSPIHVTALRRQNKLLVRTSDESAMECIRDLVSRLDVPTALVLLEVRILAVDLVDGMNSFFEYQFADGNVGGQFTTGAIAPPAPGALGVGGTGVRPTDLVFQFVDETFGARMQVLERENRVRVLATPVLLTANNEVSRLFVGREVPLNRSFSGGNVVSTNDGVLTTTGSTNIEFVPVGTTLLVTASINADRTVTLRVTQEVSNGDETVSILVPSGDGFEQQTVNVVSAQSISGTIVAKSDLAVVFGGLIETLSRNEEERVPFLGSLPLVGIFFRRTVVSEERRELVVVVRPHVLATPSENENASRGLLESLGVGEGALERSPPGAATPTARYEVFGLGGR